MLFKGGEKLAVCRCAYNFECVSEWTELAGDHELANILAETNQVRNQRASLEKRLAILRKAAATLRKSY